jgi:hypothetical protein
VAVLTLLGASSGPGGGARHALYDLLVGLHVIAALVGFGAVALSGYYGSTARHLERRGALEELHRYFRRPPRAEVALLAVPFLGGAALAVQPGGRGVGQVWAEAALALWFVAAIAFIRVVRPAELALVEVTRTGEAEMDSAAKTVAHQAGTRLTRAAALCDVVFAAALALMIFQPR